MRLFTALLPSADAADSLAAELAGFPSDQGVRWMRPQSWHVTLGFFGDREDPTVLSDWLCPRLVDYPAPTIWLQGAGNFGSTLWAGVCGKELTELARAAGAERHGRAFQAHVTVAKARTPADLRPHRRRLEQYVGPSWTAHDVVLMRSDRDQHGARYTIVRRFPLQQA